MRKDTGNFQYHLFFRKSPIFLLSSFELSFPKNRDHPFKVPGVLKWSLLFYKLHVGFSIYFGG